VAGIQSRTHWSTRVFRALLSLYPGEFRDEYGRELAMVFADRYQDATGLPQRIRVCFEAISGLLREAPREHLGLLMNDFRFAARSMRRSPGFAATVVLTLALGIGANTAIFQLINAVQFRTLPVRNPQELAELRVAGGTGRFGVNPTPYGQLTRPVWEEIRKNQQPFSGVFAWTTRGVGVGEISDLKFANGLAVSGDFFSVLGVHPFQGRLLDSADEQVACPSPRAVLSYAYWQRELGGRPLENSTRLKVDGDLYEVVGVTPPGFFGLVVGETFDIALPLCRPRVVAREVFDVNVIGRLRDGWTIDRASAQLNAMSPGIFEVTAPTGYSAESIERFKSFRLGAYSAATGVSSLRERYDTSLRLLFGITTLVLLIACANLVNLMLARAVARQREVSIRLVLGGSRTRLVRQFLAESGVLSLLGAAAGIAIAQNLSRGLVWILSSQESAPGVPPMTLDIALDWRLISFGTLMAAGTCIVLGILPALRASRVDPVSAINAGGRAMTMNRFRFAAERLMVIAQLALSIVLLTGGLLFVKSFRNLVRFDPGMRLSGIAVARFSYQALKLPPERFLDFQRELLAAVTAIPGIRAAGTTSNIPLLGGSWGHGIRIGAATGGAEFTWVSPGYFNAMGIPLLQGRDFTLRDSQGSQRVAVVNEAFVRRFSAGDSIIGQTLQTSPEPRYPSTAYQIVGVIPDTQYNSLRGERPPMVFAPDTQHPAPQPASAIMVYSAMDPATVGATIKRTVTATHPELYVDSVDFQAAIQRGLVRERMLAILAAFFGGLAAILAMVGAYGMISFVVAHRQAEIGIRLALGAKERQVVALIMRQVGWMIVVAIPLGIGIALPAGRSAGALLFGVQAYDVPTFVAACSLLAIVAGIASLIPAWRASKVNPLTSLRSE
jgi:putative ABC transport system permease protein